MTQLAGPWLTIEVRSEAQGFSQIFVAAGDDVYTEESSVIQPLGLGEQTLRFPVSPLTIVTGDRVRWDPANVPGRVLIRSISLGVPAASEDVPLSELRPVNGISAFEAQGSAVMVEAGSNDAQTEFSIAMSPAVWLFESLVWLVSGAIAVVMVAGLRLTVSRYRWVGGPRTLGAQFDPRSNSLNLIRMGLAVLVLAAHSSTAGGFADDFRFGFLGDGVPVDAFFGISGFLMARTILRRPDAYRYLWHRVVRLVPAFWFALAITAVVIAPAAALVASGAWNWGEHNSDGPVMYVLRNMSLWLLQPGINGGPSNVPESGIWNLSIWTMGWLAFCDLLLVVLASLGLVRMRGIALLMMGWGAWFLLAVAVNEQYEWFIGDGRLDSMLRFTTVFLVGVLFHLFQDWVPMHWTLALFAAAVVVMGEWLLDYDFRVLAVLPLVYLVLWLSTAVPLRWGSRTDLSYGMYLFGFPSQQILAVAGLAAAGWWVFTGAAILVALPFAVACWFLVERPAMRFRDWRPGRSQVLQRIASAPLVTAAVFASLLMAYWLLGRNSVIG